MDTKFDINEESDLWVEMLSLIQEEDQEEAMTLLGRISEIAMRKGMLIAKQILKYKNK